MRGFEKSFYFQICHDLFFSRERLLYRLQYIMAIFRWGRIGNYEEQDTNDVPDCEKPWSAFFMKDTKVTVIKTGVNVGIGKSKKNKRRSRSIGDRIESPVVRTTDPIR